MLGKGKFLVALAVIAMLVQSAAMARDYVIAAAPSWVQRVEPGGSDAVEGAGIATLLADTQTRIARGSRVEYRRRVVHVLDADGATAAGTIRFSFDPGYERLTLHAIDVLRDGNTERRLPRAKVRVEPRQSDADARRYDAVRVATVLLDDLRAGDVLDAAYSVHGVNTLYGDRKSGAFQLQFDAPVARLHARLLVADPLKVSLLPRNTQLAPTITPSRGLTDHVWDQAAVPALKVDEGVPAWFDPYPAVQWSEFADWAALVAWALPLYEGRVDSAAALRREVARITREESSVDGRLLAALRLVQGEVRSIDVSIGPGARAPALPAETFERRYGDSQDKTRLLLALTRELGIDAHAALVHTRLRHELGARQPSPAVFDRAILHVRMNGTSYWIDPTRPLQHGSLDRLVQPDYELALLIAPDSAAPVPMNVDAAALGQRKLRATFDAGAGFDKPVAYTLVTTLEGDPAEALRRELSAGGSDALQARLLAEQARQFTAIQSAGPLAIEDDTTRNRIVVTAKYRVEQMDRHDAANRIHAVTVGTFAIEEYLRRPPTTARSGPLAIAHPVDVRHAIEFRLPQQWQLEPRKLKIDTQAFVYERSITTKQRRLLIEDRYRSRTDAVLPAELARYAESVERTLGETRYTLSWTDPVPGAAPARRPTAMDRMNWPAAVLLVCALGFFGWLALQGFRYDPPAVATAGSINVALRGIDGWLVIPAIIVGATPIAIVVALSRIAPWYAADSWARLTTEGSAGYHALWAPFLLFNLVAGAALLALAILVAMMFFDRRRAVPALFITLMIAEIGVLAIDLGFAGALFAEAVVNRTAMVVGGVALFNVLWIVYFLVSERVEAAFTEDRQVWHSPLEPVVPEGPLQEASLD